MTWNGVFVPAGTPAAVITKLNAEIARILNMPEVARKLAGEGAEIATGTPQAFAKFVEQERRKLARVIAEAHIQVD